MLQAVATAKYIRSSAQKAGLVMELIRGKQAAEALAILRFTKKSVAKDVEKVLRSVIANATRSHAKSLILCASAVRIVRIAYVS